MRELRPDVVTLDIDMPRMDGIETLRRIRAEFGTPVIMVSSLSQKEAELTFRAMELGAFDANGLRLQNTLRRSFLNFL